MDLGRRIQGSRLEALRENRQGQKRAALVHLRRMKQFQAARDSRMSSLYTLETSLDQVRLACLALTMTCVGMIKVGLSVEVRTRWHALEL